MADCSRKMSKFGVVAASSCLVARPAEDSIPGPRVPTFLHYSTVQYLLLVIHVDSCNGRRLELIVLSDRFQ